MSLYYEAAGFFTNSDNVTGSLASRVYGNKALKSKPAHVFALISEAAKWSGILSRLIENADVLRLEKKLTPILALLLTHDLLLAKQGVAAPKDHVLRLAIERHKARLSAELVKARIKAGYGTIQAWRTAVENGLAQDGTSQGSTKARHPRWIRINTLRTTLEASLKTSFGDFEQPVSIQKLSSSQTKSLAIDEHIPNLVAIPQSNDLSSSQAYRLGNIIFQDKASCFSAYLLDPQPDDGDIIDACAAPGNKTTHLAALLAESRAHCKSHDVKKQQIFACERDKTRAGTLEKMVNIAGAEVHCLPGQDFLRLVPKDVRWQGVGALLLDPSCSGSGIVGRDDESDTMPPVILPRVPDQINGIGDVATRGKKRKRNDIASSLPATQATSGTNEKLSRNAKESVVPSTNVKDERADLDARLSSLSAFQLKIIKHSFSFPSATKVVYSTCSIHVEENEQVVLRALSSPIARECGWRILKRDEQVDGMQRWTVRGNAEATKRIADQDVDCCGADGKDRRWTDEEIQAIADGCLRCEKGTDQGTMGFFVAGFVRDEVRGGYAQPSQLAHAKNGELNDGGDSESEFAGFSDSE